MNIKNINDCWLFIERHIIFAHDISSANKSLRMERMRILCARIANPHQDFKIIHVAGSKGKGSVATYLAQILNEQGYRTGLFTSPHLQSYKERFQIMASDVKDELLIEAFQSIAASCTGNLELPGLGQAMFFELLTLVALKLFSLAGCEWVVLEAGLGGRLDATNIVVPVATVITRIELEHEKVLGPGLEKIAAEKAGIIKKRVPVFCLGQLDAVKKIIVAKAAELEAPLFFLDEHLIAIEAELSRTGAAVKLSWEHGIVDEFRLSCPSKVQPRNAALAWLCIKNIHPGTAAALVARALEKTRLRGRLQIYPARGQGPTLILDVAHTVESLNSLLDSIDLIYGQDTDRTLLFSVLADKNYKEMARALSCKFKNIVICSTTGPKENAYEEVYKCFLENVSSAQIRLIVSARAAFTELYESTSGLLLVTGSFYLIGEVLDILA